MFRPDFARSRRRPVWAWVFALLVCFVVTGIAREGAQDDIAERNRKYPIGYADTPELPGSKYKVHDIDRPHPPVITPGASFSHGAPPPADAIVLFDGDDHEGFDGGPWSLVDGTLEVNGKGNIRTKRRFGDVQLHLEWRCPNPPQAHSQKRGNSGVFFMGMYEVQILDSYDNVTYADGQAASLYGQTPPAVNASKKPGEWQTYDILFTAPRFNDEGQLVSPASVTVFHNGAAVHVNQSFMGRTAHRAVAKYAPHGPEGPIVLQDHRDNQPMQFRNIWARDL